MVKVTIDGRELEFPPGTSLFDACAEARGEPLPHFCYHPDLSVAGVCRLCQVEVEGMPKLTIACNTTVRDGMVVHTRSEKVKQASRRILEMHLINHPVDCPICDQAGECGLQDQYMNYGLYESEVTKADKVHKSKAEVVGPHVILDKERCVLCSRCVRFCDEVTGTGELGIFNRGDRAEVGIAPGRELNNNYSLNTVDICPVGALTSRDFRFKKRVWLLKSVSSVCPGCATGCNVRIDHEGDRIYRLKPRRNDAVNGPWMCDLGRYAYRGVHNEKRLTKPGVRGADGVTPIAWAELLAALNGAVGGGALWIASPHQTLEELSLFRDLAGDDERCGGCIDSDRGEGDDMLLSSDRSPDRAALGLCGLPQLAADELATKARAASAVVVYGGDPVADVPGFAEAVAGRPLIYLGIHVNATAVAATHVAPMSAWAEKDGIFINGKGRLQAFRRAVARPEEAREDWRFLAEWLVDRGDADVPAGLPALRRRAAVGLDLPAGIELEALPPEGAATGGEE